MNWRHGIKGPAKSETGQQQLVRTVLMSSAWHLETLRTARALGLPDWAIGAGFVRSAAWDHLHGFTERTPVEDIDLLYFDPANLGKQREQEIEAALSDRLDRPWSARNQARMHIRNGDDPCHSIEDALGFWLETPTAVAVRLDTDENLEIIAPFGLADLANMRGRMTPAGRRNPDACAARMKAKNWPATWPRVKVEGLD